MSRLLQSDGPSALRRRPLRLAATLVTTAAIVLSLGACSAAVGGSGGSAGGKGITAWGITGDKPYTVQAVTAWNAKNPDAKITAEYFGTNDYKSKIQTAIGSSTSPNLVYTWGGGTMRSYVKAGLIKDLTPYLKDQSAFTGKLVDSVVATGQVDGKTYAVPEGAVAPVLFYYNKDVLKKAGVTQPTTWDELLASIPKIRAAGYQPIALGGQSQWPYLMWIEYLVDRIGGPQPFENILDNKPNAWSDPAVIQATTMIQQLIKAGGFSKGFASVSADSNADLAQVVTGKAAMMLQGAWDYSSITGIDSSFISSGKLGWGPFPAVTGGKGDPKDIVGNPSQYWAISSKASKAQTETAVKFLTTQLWTDKYTETLTSTGNIPPLKGVDSQLKGDFTKSLYQMIQDAPNFQQSWDLALSPAASTAFWTQLSLLFGLSSTPQQFSDAMNKTIGK